MNKILVSEKLNKILRIAITNKCNNKCIYCHSEGMNDQTKQNLTIDDYIFIIEATEDLFDGYAIAGG